MAINITAAGGAGTHSFRRVNVNPVDNFLYFRDSNIPLVVVTGATFIYNDGTGSVDGISEGQLVAAERVTGQVLKFKDVNNVEIDITGFTAGGIVLNTPVVFDNILQIESSTATNQSVKYYTAGEPLPGLTSGDTYFLKNVPAPFAGTQALYPFTSQTFTTAGQTGRVGPTIAQVRAAYTGAGAWSGTYLQQGDFQGYQDWTVPISGVYEFTARGASGFENASTRTSNISSTQISSNIAIINTTTAHGLQVGRQVTITGATTAVYNGTFVVTTVNSATQFRYALTNANIANTASSGTVAIGPAFLTMDQASITSNVATIRTTTPHRLQVGRQVTIVGASNTVFNGTYTITEIFTTTQFRFARTNANIGVAGVSGNVSVGQGRGAIVKGRVILTKGEIITFAVGQVGGAPAAGSIYGGSGGGTFVVRKTGKQPLFVAGGGTAEANPTPGLDAVLTQLAGTSTNGTAANALTPGLGGIAGSVPPSIGNSAAGGGFLSRGQDSLEGEKGGGGFNDGLQADDNTPRLGGDGGFGGGGSSDSQNVGQSAGAGGYSGGGGSRTTIASHSGGGGGSFITTVATDVATSTGLYQGANTLSGQPITALNSFNTGEGSVAVTLISTFTNGNEVYPTASDAEAGTNKIAVTPAGSSYHAFVPINFDLENNQVNSTSTHGFVDGEAVTFTFTGTAPAGLQNGVIYYLNVINPYSYKISTTPSPSFALLDFTTPSTISSSNFIRRVIVNTTTDVLTINDHGFLVDQPVIYDTGGGNPIQPLQNGVVYYIAEVLSSNQIKLKLALTPNTPINLTSAGTGTNHSFIFSSVNLTENTIYIPNHGLISGQAVKYSNGGNASIGGLVDNTTYYVERENASIIRLSLSRTLSPIVDLTAVGVGTQSLIVTSLDLASNTVTLPSHGFLQGELVEYDAKGNTPVGGLTTATPYYVIFVDGDNIKLALSPEDATEGVAVDLTSTGTGIHSFRSLSKTPDGIYTIDDVPTPKSFTAIANGNIPLLTKSFNPRTSLNLQVNAIYIESHGFITGTRVTYNQGPAATDIGGLEDGEEYFVIGVNRDYFRLATTAENASAGIPLVLTDFGTGVLHSVVSNQINGNITGGGNVSVEADSVLVNGVGTQFSKILKVGDRFRLFPDNTIKTITFADTDINITTNIITKNSHGFVNGDTVIFETSGGVAPAPLINGYYYFARAVSVNTITLHSSRADSLNDVGAIDITSAGTGSEFKLTNIIPSGPIIRTITAIGSDTQITVDRSYASAYSSVSYSYPTFVYVRPEGYSLHRPFDGGVEMSVGSNTSLGQIVRQTRKYFRYQSGKGIQTSAGLNFKPSIDLESMTRQSSTTIVCKTRRPHGLITGLFIVISQAENSTGALSPIYNGTFQVIVEDLTTFRISSSGQVPEGTESRAFGFPQFFVREWSNGAIRSGMFDFQNGMFFEFDGQKLYCVRRSSTQQIAGTVACLQGSELVFGTGTKFTAQLDVGDFIVMRGQTYRVADIESDTRMTVRPEYKGASGTEKEFDPGNGTTGVVRTATDTFAIVSHGFADGIPVVYNSIDGEPIGGLINGRTYYVDLINNNNFKLLALPDAEVNVNLSSVGTTAVHSFIPAKSGIIVTKTVDTKVPQEDWSIDPCDGTGPTGYNLDISKIQMVYIDYSWYGAGKIRFGFKTTNGQVQYVHEFVHNNQLFESYFRSGNLPARYEVATFENPTYIPFLFHWGTSVMMDGRFDDDNAYLFTQASQNLDVSGTTVKSFASSGIDLTTDLFTVQTHAFRTGDVVQFESISPTGLPGANTQNPATQVIGSQTLPNLTNSARYKVFVNSPNLIHLTPETATITFGATVSRSTGVVTVVTATPHNIPSSNNVGVYGLPAVANIPAFYVGPVTVTNPTTFTFPATGSFTVASTPAPGAVIAEVLNFTTQGNTQFTYFLYPNGSLNNTSGPNYQPLISLRLSPSVSSGLTGKLGDRDVINRMQLRLREVGISTNELVEVKLLLNARLNNLNFQSVDAPSLVQIVEHTAADTVSGGVQVYNFRASGSADGGENSTVVNVAELFELSNSILGGDSTYPDGPDIMTVAVSRLSGDQTITGASLTWTEAQA
jgi:hypothetical protein